MDLKKSDYFGSFSSPVFKSSDDFKFTTLDISPISKSKIVEEGEYHCEKCNILIDKYCKFKDACLLDNESIYCYDCYHKFDDYEYEYDEFNDNIIDIGNIEDIDNNYKIKLSSDVTSKTEDIIRGLCIKCSKPFNRYCNKCISTEKKKGLKIIIDKNRLHPTIKLSKIDNTVPKSGSTNSSPFSSRSGGSSCKPQHRRTYSNTNFLSVSPESFYKNLIKIK